MSTQKEAQAELETDAPPEWMAGEPETVTPPVDESDALVTLDSFPMRSDSVNHERALTAHKPSTLLDYAALMTAARTNRRDVGHALKLAISICTIDDTAAKECFYSMPRGGKKIAGPSIGLAETLAACYGNLNVTCDHTDIDRENKAVDVRGFVIDCETGLSASDSVRRRIQDKNGAIYNEDMINITIGAAKSILYRNLVLRVIPRPLVRKVYEAACNVAYGKGESFSGRQSKCIKHWETLGISKDRLLNHLGKTQVADINLQDFEYLLGIEQAIKMGDATLDEVFKLSKKSPQTLDALESKLAGADQ